MSQPRRIAIIESDQGNWYAVGWNGARKREIQNLLRDVDHLADWPSDAFGRQRKVTWIDLPANDAAPAPTESPASETPADVPSPVLTADQIRDRIYAFLTTSGPHPLGLIAGHVDITPERAQELLQHGWFVRTANGLYETRNSRERSRHRSCSAAGRLSAPDLEDSDV